MSFKLLNQEYILCNSPDTVRQVFLDRHDIYDKKSPQMRHALKPLLGDGLFVSDGELWKARRKACSPPFESTFLADFATVMTASAVETGERWNNLPDGATVDVLNEMARLTAQIIGRTVFGDDVSDNDAAKVVNGFTEYQHTINQLDYADTFGLPFLRRLGNPFKRKKAAKAAAEVHQVIDQIIERYKQDNKPDRLTLLSVLLDGDMSSSGRRGCPMGAEAARNEAIVMFMAGHETTANALAWSWYLLDGCERSRRKMYDEIRGSKVKKGTIMLALPWLLHRHELEWENPNAFYPERFMPGNPRPDKFLYIPFSVGHRVCLGLRFGLTEGILCLATLAQRFELRLPENHQVEIECRLTLRPKDGLPMVLKKRG
ncbi:MAG: cytochrome P450 [Amphritea sp.]|nr:cytochrome P450 [Amphritea sp.]